LLEKEQYGDNNFGNEAGNVKNAMSVEPKEVGRNGNFTV
jgi:hypothetical protein